MGEPNLLPPLPTGAKLPAGDFSVLVKIRGHASSRWRGSKDTLDAINRNQALSVQRANSVRAVVERQLRKELGSIAFTIESKGEGIWAAPDGVFKPDDNEPITRSVTVTLHLKTKTYQAKAIKRPPRRIPAKTRLWYLKVLRYDVFGVGYANLAVKIALRNAVSKKEMSYEGTLHGGGIVINPFDLIKRVSSWTTIRRDKLVGEEVSFETNREMGFSDFDGQLVGSGTLNAKLGGGASYTYLSFNSLGSRAQLLAFDHKFGAGLPKLNAAYMAGKISMIGTSKGDYIEEPVDDLEMIAVNERDFGGGVVVTFPTGKSGYDDIPADERRRLTEFITKWANNILLLRRVQGP